MKELRVSVSLTSRDSELTGRYFQEIARYQPLRGEEEIKLTRLIRQGDQRAQEQLIRANLRFVVSVAKQYQHRGLPLADLINEGNIGLIEATQHFDETRGFKFISYAVWWIRQRILKALEDHPRHIRLPKNQISHLTQVNTNHYALAQKLEREPTITELAEATGLNENQVTEVLSIEPVTTSLDSPYPGSEAGFGPLDTLSNLSEPADHLIQAAERPLILRQILAGLDEREQKVIQLGFGFEGDRQRNDVEVGDILGLSPQLVQKARAKALVKLRTYAKVMLLTS